MNNITAAFHKGKAYIAFITCGDPDFDTTRRIALEAVKNGASILELNIPFSDPTGVDALIQQANIRALKAGATTDRIFEFVKNLRREVGVPLIFSTYANVVFTYGPERFMRECREAGVEGLIVPDLPYEEQDEFLPACRQFGVTLISMISATSRERIQAIAEHAEGFLYIMTCPGGSEEQLGDIVSRIHQYTDLPCAVCISASDSPYLLGTAALTDGIIEDTPIVELTANQGQTAAPYVGAFIRNRRVMLDTL